MKSAEWKENYIASELVSSKALSEQPLIGESLLVVFQCAEEHVVNRVLFPLPKRDSNTELF